MIIFTFFINRLVNLDHNKFTKHVGIVLTFIPLFNSKLQLKRLVKMCPTLDFVKNELNKYLFNTGNNRHHFDKYAFLVIHVV